MIKGWILCVDSLQERNDEGLQELTDHINSAVGQASGYKPLDLAAQQRELGENEQERVCPVCDSDVE